MENLVSNTTLAAAYKGRRIFVTGHTGFKGAWLISWLHQLGAVVRGYALAPATEKNLYDIVAPFVSCESIIADIRDKEKLQESIMAFQPDYIFHLAAQALVRRSYEIPAETFDVNVAGTGNLLEALRSLNKKCTVVVVTTDKVYENREAAYHYREDDRLGGYDPYSASKAATEILVSSFRNSFFNTANYPKHQKAIVSARAGNVIGGGDWSADRIIPDIVRSLEMGEPVAVRNPSAIRPWQHVLEPLGGYLLAGMLLDKDATAYSGAYNFGPQPQDHLPVKELVETAISCWGAGTWTDTHDSAQPHEAGLLQLSIVKASAVLGWQPKLFSKEAVEWTIDWYRQPAEKRYEYTLQQIQNYQQR